MVLRSMPLMRVIKKEIEKIIALEVSTFIWRSIAKDYKYRMCINCGFMFKPRSKVHHLCSRKCYSKLHRIPGFIRRIVNQKD
jgi:hypothetical protein